MPKRFNPITPPFDDIGDITPAQATDLTDGGDSSLHYHSSDRNRSNHTGTQPASTISDFNTAADARVTYSALNANGSVGTGATQVAQGNHSHGGSSAPVDQAAYFFSTTTTAADPGGTFLRFNNATLSSVTQIYFDQLGVSSVDYSELLRKAVAGDTVIIASTTNSTKWVRFQIDGALTNNTGWFTARVDFVSSGSGGLFSANENLSVLFESNRALRLNVNSSGTVPSDAQGADGDVDLPIGPFVAGGYTAVPINIKGAATAGSWTESDRWQIPSATSGIKTRLFLVSRTASHITGKIPGWRLELPKSFPLPSTSDMGASSGILWASNGYYSSVSGTMNGTFYPSDASVPPIPLTFFSMHATVSVLPEAGRTMFFGMATMGNGATSQFGIGVEITSAGAVAIKTRDALLSVYVTLVSGMTIAAGDRLIFERFGHRFSVYRLTAASPQVIASSLECTVTGASTGYAQIFGNGSVGILTDSNTGRILIDFIFG